LALPQAGTPMLRPTVPPSPRRRFAWWVLLLSTAGLAALACSGGNKPTGPEDGGQDPVPGAADLFPDGPPATVRLAGTVDTAQIGGTGLVLLSVHDADGGLVHAGQFDLTVSAAGPQVLVAVDASGAVRALAASVPGGNEKALRPPEAPAAWEGFGAARARAAASLTVDAGSTAMGYLLLCPGIGTPDPAVCADRVAAIAGYDAFGALVGALRQGLPTASLAQLSQDRGFQQRVQDVLIAFNRDHAGAGTTASAKASPQVGVVYPESAPLGGIVLDFAEANLPAVALTIRNEGYRTVDIQRRDVGADGSSRWVRVAKYDDPPVVPGAHGWDNKYGLRVGDPGTSTEVFDRFSMEGLTRSEYWASGPGFGAPRAEAPADLPSAEGGAAAWGVSVASSVLWPMLAMLAGTGEPEAELYARGPDFGAGLWAELGHASGAAGSLGTLATQAAGSDGWQHAARLKESLQAMASAMAQGSGPRQVASLAGVTESQARSLCRALEAVVDASVLAHVVVPYAAWTGFPPVTVYTLFPRDNAAFFALRGPYAPADGKALAGCVYHLNDWLPGQDRTTDQGPGGQGAGGVPVAFTTSLGTFQASGTSAYAGETTADGEVALGVVSAVPGVAVVTARVPGYADFTCQARLTFCTPRPEPVQVEVPNQSPFTVQCAVAGPGSLGGLRFVWTTDADVWLVDPETGEKANSGRIGPRVLCGRQQGQAHTGKIRVQVRYQGPGHLDVNEGDFVGEAEVSVSLSQMHYPVTLMGLVERTGTATGVRYGPSFPKVDRAVSYGVRGTGFNDPLFYGNEYHGGIDIRRDEYEDLGNSLFFPITSSGGSGDSPLSDEELIANVAWRFEGGTWFMFPGFDPPKP
jgi:hypothetical protein